MNILKTFEIFLRTPISIFQDKFFQIVSLQTENIFEHKPSIDVTLLKNKAQITVVNNEKLYKLLSIVQHRAELKNTKERATENETNKR